jgi:nucleoside-diphosphate-sugar epimerase
LPTEPFSPYGVSKLAAEKLVQAYVANFGLDAVILRYFSLYGPRQRPDMGYHLFCEAMLDERPITVFGDGRQRRSNTYVSDAVSATVAALAGGAPGDVLNVCGDETIALLDAIGVLADELGVQPVLEFREPRPGDQRDTAGDAGRAREVLGWAPRVPVETGLRRQAAWHRDLRS